MAYDTANPYGSRVGSQTFGVKYVSSPHARPTLALASSRGLLWRPPRANQRLHRLVIIIIGSPWEPVPHMGLVPDARRSAGAQKGTAILQALNMRCTDAVVVARCVSAPP